MRVPNKRFWLIFTVLIFISPFIFYYLYKIAGPSGDSVRLLEKSWGNNFAYLSGSYFFLTGLVALNLTLLGAFAGLSYFTIVNLIGTIRNTSQRTGFFGVFAAALFAGVVCFKSLGSFTDLLSRTLDVNEHFHTLVFTKDGGVAFTHDFKGLVFKNPADSLLKIKGVCYRLDKQTEDAIILQYRYAVSFIFADTIIHSAYLENSAATPVYGVYKRLKLAAGYLTRPVEMVLTQCPSIHEYPPGFASQEISGSEPYIFNSLKNPE